MRSTLKNTSNISLNWTGQILAQALGPISAFLTTWIISRKFGPSSQGEFAELKAIIDLLVIIGLFGFPQSFVFLINKKNTNPVALKTFSEIYSILAIPFYLILLYTASTLTTLYTSQQHSKLYSLLLISASAAALTYHGMMRGIYLSKFQDLRFAILTIAPAIAILLGITADSLYYESEDYAIIFLISCLTCIVITLAMTKSFIVNSEPKVYRKKIPWHDLFSNGAHLFTQGVMLAVQPIIAYTVIKKYGGSSLDIGQFNVALVLMQGLVTPVTMIAPLLYAKWTLTSPSSLIAKVHQNSHKILIALAFGAIIFSLIGYVIPSLIFGNAYQPANILASIILATLPLRASYLILASAFYAQGGKSACTNICVVRIATFIAILAGSTIFQTQEITITIAVAWSAAEVFAHISTMIAAAKLTHENERNSKK